MLGILNKSVVYKSKDIILKFYKSLICAHLEYCTAAWSPHYVKDKELLERIQCRFLMNDIGVERSTVYWASEEVELVDPRRNKNTSRLDWSL